MWVSIIRLHHVCSCYTNVQSMAIIEHNLYLATTECTVGRDFLSGSQQRTDFKALSLSTYQGSVIVTDQTQNNIRWLTSQDGIEDITHPDSIGNDCGLAKSTTFVRARGLATDTRTFL